MLDHIQKIRSPAEPFLGLPKNFFSYSSFYNSLRRRSVRIKIGYSCAAESNFTIRSVGAPYVLRLDIAVLQNTVLQSAP